MKATLEREIAVLKKCEPAPDHIADEKGERIDLFLKPSGDELEQHDAECIDVATAIDHNLLLPLMLLPGIRETWWQEAPVPYHEATTPIAAAKTKPLDIDKIRNHLWLVTMRLKHTLEIFRRHDDRVRESQDRQHKPTITGKKHRRFAAPVIENHLAAKQLGANYRRYDP
jgi:hypothetical protein